MKTKKLGVKATAKITAPAMSGCGKQDDGLCGNSARGG
jgi:hypothetical protein